MELPETDYNGGEFTAAAIKGQVEVQLYRRIPPEGEGSWVRASRSVSCSFAESFATDEELEAALDAFKSTVLAAARR